MKYGTMKETSLVFIIVIAFLNIYYLGDNYK